MLDIRMLVVKQVAFNMNNPIPALYTQRQLTF